MSYVNRRSFIKTYCPAIKKYVMIKVFSHNDEHNRFASRKCGHQCLEDHCSLDICKCQYEDGKLTLRG